MTSTSSVPDLLKRFGLLAVTLSYALSLAVMPAHGHSLGLFDQATDFQIPDPSEPDHYLDCFFCQVLTSAAHPAIAPVLSPGLVLAEADPRLALPEPAHPANLRSNARAPPSP